MVHRRAGDGPLRHGRSDRLRRVLHDRDAAALLDRQQTRRTVLQLPGQHDADDAWAVGGGGGSEQRVDGGPAEILLVAMGQPDAAALHRHVQVGRGDIDMPG